MTFGERRQRSWLYFIIPIVFAEDVRKRQVIFLFGIWYFSVRSGYLNIGGGPKGAFRSLNIYVQYIMEETWIWS